MSQEAVYMKRFDANFKARKNIIVPQMPGLDYADDGLLKTNVGTTNWYDFFGIMG